MDTLEVLTLPLALYALSTSVLDSFSLGYWINEKASTPLNDIQTEGGAFVTYILADTLEYRKRFNHKAVKKNLTIPEWLNEAAAAAGVNFSQVLQDALKAQLHLGYTYPIRNLKKKPPLLVQGKFLGYTRRMASNNMKIN